MGTVVPPLYFAHLSYTPPPGYTGHFPGLDTVPPGYSYRDNLVTARSEALHVNTNRPEVWRSLSSREFSRKSRQHDPNLSFSDDHLPISNDEGIMPGYKGHVPHLRSNGIPGYSFKRLTGKQGQIARTNRETISYISEQRQAFADAARQIAREQQDLDGPGSQDQEIFSPEDADLQQLNFKDDISLSAVEMRHATAAWLEFHSKMEEHHRLPSWSFRRLDVNHLGYVTPANVKTYLKTLGIWTSDKTFTALMQGLGCNANGEVTVIDYMRACELSLKDALAARNATSEESKESLAITKRKKPKFLARTSCKNDSLDPSMNDSSQEGDEMRTDALPMLVFTPRADPMVEFAVKKNAQAPPQSVEKKKNFGKQGIAGYAGHQPEWRCAEWEELQNQLLLRVKPGMRMQPATMRSVEDEVDDKASPQLKEAKAAWKLILANFEEFKKVQNAFRLVDKDFSGLITRDELRRLIENVLYIEMSNAAFDIIFNTMDRDHSGELSFEEFAAAITDPYIELTEDVATTSEVEKSLARMAMYKDMDMRTGKVKWDTGPSGQILFNQNETLTIGDSQWVIQNLRKKIEGRFFEIKRYFAQFDMNGDGSISRSEFVQGLRRHNLVPEGGEEALTALCNVLDSDDSGNIDYLEFQKAFCTVAPQLQMADPSAVKKKAVERQLDRKYTSEYESEEDVIRVEEGERELRTKANAKTNFFIDTAFNDTDISRFWQQETRPGHPTQKVKEEFQKRAVKAGLSVDNPRMFMSTTGEPLSSPVSPIFKVKQRKSSTANNSAVDQRTPPPTGKLSPSSGTPTRFNRQNKGVGHLSPGPPEDKGEQLVRTESGRETPVVMGVKVTNRKGTSGGGGERGSGSPNSQRSSSSVNFTAEEMASAEAVWNLVRESSSTTHGSMQRAFRSVDSDGSGRIERDELRHLLTVHLSIDATDEDIEIIFSKLDKGGKGNVTYAEFVAGLRGSIAKQGGYRSALEAEEHPLDVAYGRKLAALQPPTLHRRDWDRTITKAVTAGNEVFARGAAGGVQYGDRYAWKAAMPYVTSGAKIGANSGFTPREPIQPPSQGRSPRCTAPTLAQYSRQAGVRYVDEAPDMQRWEANKGGNEQSPSSPATSARPSPGGTYTPMRPRPKPECTVPAPSIRKQKLLAKSQEGEERTKSSDVGRTKSSDVGRTKSVEVAFSAA